ncbi:MAG TPA: NAD(P)/FAD-dependent oxidoreductase [Candidatus Binatia bacterium]|nr:NAD(P)/FAD-dependent oxidoreductase [Candidatus Binatia bacterium]
MSACSNACVIGSGPNGLAAAIVLAQAGVRVEVREAQATAGGGVRTMELTLPGFLHDFGSAVHPLAAGSPFFSTLPLREHGLEWIHSPAPVAHPLDDGTAVVLERNLDEAKSALGIDGQTWKNLLSPFVERWSEFAREVLRPPTRIPRHPFLLARFGMSAVFSAAAIARRFKSPRTRALFAGLAAHSFLSLDEPLSGGFGLVLGISAHAVGWPIPRRGSQSITNSLCSYLESLGGAVRTSSPVESMVDLPDFKLFLCDVTPRQLVRIAGPRLSPGFRREMGRYRYGPGVFKVDYALSQPIPWKARECLRAATVHVGGGFEEIAASEKAVRTGNPAERPFVLLSQPTLFDSTRAPAGKHIAWAYCHVPNGSGFDMLPRLEDQIERFAPGFRETILARNVLSPADLERRDANLIGGDIGGGVMDIRNFLVRPTWRHYATSDKKIFICSSSTPPGGGVHGMCGYHAAKAALRNFRA